jgi:ribosome-associated protein
MTDLPDDKPQSSDSPDAPAGAETIELPEPTPLRPGLPRRRPVARKRKVDESNDEPAEQQAQALARRIVDLASDKKASDIVLLEIRELTTLADYFVIASGASERQLGAIADGIVEGLREEGMKPIGREGGANAHWLLLDFGSVIVHIMAAPERDFYQLERLWSDAPLLLRLQ